MVAGIFVDDVLAWAPDHLDRECYTMQKAEVERWISTLKAGDEVGVYTGSRLLFKTSVAKRTPSGRVVCEPGGTFKPCGDIHGRLSDQDRRLRPITD